jgi:FixJ family two-component response regulator
MKQHEGDGAGPFPSPGCDTFAASPGLSSLAFSAGAFCTVSPTDHVPLVYVVDDDEALRDSLRWLLESAGYRVMTYPTAERFLLACEPGAAACLVLDVRLPGMSGPDLQQELNRRGETLPIIFITGHGDAQTGLDALKNGAWQFLQKPFRDAQLLDLIAHVARRKYAAGALKQASGR